jgi:hypothetical protein
VKTHDLKTWPEFFDALLTGKKTFELRNDDRDFEVGDYLCLKEWDPTTKAYTGREMVRTVEYLLRHRPDAGCAATFGLAPGYAILALCAVPSDQRGTGT